MNKTELFERLGLQYGLGLAPMAGYTDRAMRVVCHMHGAEMSVTEMVSSKALAFGDKKTYTLARILPDEGPVSVQIFGSEPDVMAEAALRLSEPRDGDAAPISIDINMGCPVNKIYSNGDGSALMKDPDKIYRITEAVSHAIKIPCTVKIRTGIDADRINAVECALAAESGGAALITVHGRTRTQMYSGTVDRETIAKVKSSVRIPVFANGDVTDSESAVAMLKETNADGLMIGRGAVGNPFVFEEIRAAIAGKEYYPPTVKERIECGLLQLRLAIEEKGEDVAVKEARKQIALYLHSFRGAAGIRALINRAVSYAEVEEALLSALKEKSDA